MNRDWAGRGHPEIRQVLHVLGEDERTRLKHQDAVVGQLVAVEEMLG